MKKITAFALALSIVFGLIPFSQEVHASSVATVWDGSVAKTFDGGSGSEADPYRIATAEQLAYFASSVNSGKTYSNKYIVLTADIYLNDIGSYGDWNESPPQNAWTPIGKSQSSVFSGSFDGRNHTIQGMYVSGNTGAGFFGVVTYDNAVVKNVTFENAYVSGSCAGGLTACVYTPEFTSSQISNITYNGVVAASSANSGGILGKHEMLKTFSSRCYVSKCSVSGSISGAQNVGGILGYDEEVYIDQCTVAATITSTGDYAGGIAGNGGWRFRLRIHTLRRYTHERQENI